MIKILDLDKMFDKYIADYVYKNIGKIDPEKIEDQMPIMYEEFGNKKLDVLEGFTPNEYYRQFNTQDLIKCLKQHIEEKVSVSDFLCEALTSKDDIENVAINSLKDDKSEEFTLYLLNMLLEIKSTKCGSELLNFVLSDYSEPIKELSTEILCCIADGVKEGILDSFNEGAIEDEKTKECLTEILSNCSRDDRVLNILIEQFNSHREKAAEYCQFLTKYGDEKALPVLLTAIEDTKINYADFTELRFAIESLGGEYTKERDFTHDKYYNKIKGVKRNNKIV